MRLALLALAACSSAHPAAAPDGAAAPDAPAGDAAIGDAATGCASVTDQAAVAIATAPAQGEYALTVRANSYSATSWGEAGNEAVVLAVSSAQRGLVGHLVLHQGQTPFDYAMHVGALAQGDTLALQVSTLSAPGAVRAATACDVHLIAVSTLGAAADGVLHAPELRWPVQKAFNDLPMVVGWSAARHTYQTVMTNEDGGTAEQCGGGATGMQAEIARWGRSLDIEDHYSYGGASPTWERCTGTVPITTTAIRYEAAHPILYWGDGHNRLFEDRGGYGQTCGTAAPEKPDGDLAGWNIDDPSTALADDPGDVIILRPLPVDMDALGYAQFPGRREGIADSYAPWLYRITSLELAKEGKIDDAKTFDMSRYLYVDVQVADVGGTGDSYCSLVVSGGFKLRAVTGDGTTISSPQITADYASGGAHDWKRVAIALPAGIGAADIDHFVFDAYDDDGIYLTALGDAFVPVADGTTNGARLDYVRHGVTPYQDYVDDDSSSCSGGVNTAGPGGLAYTCVGGEVTLPR
ncbi:MAG TPA: hypothetical protein VLX92_28285 [Kofleriaceae bacterium]|nr:hypothetical protein [Kofleriaceae bacterium]